MTKILSVNAGSSSLKFQLLEMPAQTVITKGLVERIGFNDGVFNIKFEDQKIEKVLPIKDHSVAVHLLLEALLDLKIVKNYDEISGVGHRVVHGGEKFDRSVVITDEVLAEIDALSELAPLHNPAHVLGIKAFMKELPHAVPVAVFDTAFHQTMAEDAYLYPVKYDWYKKYGVRKYGFHGTSHQYVAKQCAKLMNKPLEETKMITIHLGNGGSLTAIKGGHSVDTSMGFTPLAGIMMGTRSGDIDPAVLPFVMAKENLTVDQAVNALNKESGLYGVSGESSDMRDILKLVAQKDERAMTAFNLYVKRICDYIGAYYIYLGGVDALVFTAGIGENSTPVRKAIVDRLGVLGIQLDDEANQVMGEEQLISTPDSQIKVFAIPTNEELMIAEDTYAFVK
ncbi:MAG: acetate kinase [Turicibacter sp.]|uniref:Acetate kinase n=1 Tax=Turicibacter faecis TaxID=2963365 RepID=A0ABM8IJR3_9FIRM|nr:MULTISPECIES: acetate kinase [unclassified Turicibacter]MBC9720181.1 acetate kinase [Lactobacillus sp.]MCI8700954.1 acetate kinase [Turicibacter sp.]BEH91486.1 acetate kinase [Turicibacter sp. TC023]MCI9350587.1 acetate kinase [Turicibacter sp.]MCU7204872.1 acetate kinase [Turicibacter sp. TA25]